MEKRFVAIWFRFLKTDWYSRRIPALNKVAFALTAPDHGRIVIAASNPIARQKGIYNGMPLADARAIHPSLQVLDDKPDHAQRILNGLAEWCIRYTPWVAVDMPDGLILDATGCAHLWGGEAKYLADIHAHLRQFGYDARIAMAGTIGAAWALSRCGDQLSIVNGGDSFSALLPLPAASLRLEPETAQRLAKLGLKLVKDFISMPRAALRRRFGEQLLARIDEALGFKEEFIQPIQIAAPYYVRLPCLEPIVTRAGIERALEQLLQLLCGRLQQEGKGLRDCTFKGFRVDGKVETITIGTNRATANDKHLFKLFEIKLDMIEPALGIEVFLLEASRVEEVTTLQEKLWEKASGLQSAGVVQLLDRFAGKFGEAAISRYLPDEHHWPERSVKLAATLNEKPAISWTSNAQRPVRLLKKPEPIQVTAPIPDYPPMNFRYKGILHKVVKADGPERIEQEWWLEKSEHRDYYCVEDEAGHRYWIFRLGHYDAEKFSGWFLHGFFA